MVIISSLEVTWLKKMMPKVKLTSSVKVLVIFVISHKKKTDEGFVRLTTTIQEETVYKSIQLQEERVWGLCEIWKE